MLTPTPEQAAIIEAARNTSDNILVNALAGSAKTTTLEMICQKITSIPILSLAFNKRIANEMSKRLPSHVECRTMNALGHRVWSQAIGKRLIVDTKKMHSITTGLIREMPRDDQGDLWEALADTLGWLRAAKRDGYIPPRWRHLSTGYSVGTMAEWLRPYPEEPTLDQCELIDKVLSLSIEAAFAGGIDFDDQIYMPVCFGASWPKFPLVLIDEFQDLNELQHEMLSKLAVRRLIGVGDPWQSIYGFRGAKQNGMAAARDRWDMREFPLSITFRVPRLGVERAWFRVPHMRWFDGQVDGRIITLNEWNEEDVPEGCAIICRNNAPLFSMALRLLSRDRGIKLVGMDIGAGLVRQLKKLGPLDMNHQHMITAISRWQSEALRTAKREETIYEKVECLHVLVQPRNDNWTLRDAISRAEDLFKRDGQIQLLSAHKAKGLEWQTVLILDPWRMPSRFAKEGTEEYEQELNVRYVAETRFKDTMIFANLADWT